MADDQELPDVSTAWRAARARWPGVSVGELEFADWVHARPGALHLEDLYLALACRNGDRHALIAFETLLADLRVLRGIPASDRDELLQRLRTRLLVADGDTPPRIASYNGHGTLDSWLRTAALRQVADLHREQGDAVPADCLFDVPSSAPDPELNYLRGKYGDEVSSALRRGFARLTPRERLLLRQHGVDRLSVGQLAQLYGSHETTIVRRIARARLRLARLGRDELRRRLNASAAEIDSVLRLLDSQLELSFPSC